MKTTFSAKLPDLVASLRACNDTSFEQVCSELGPIAPLSEFQDNLNYRFRDMKKLVQALIHQSFFHENKDFLPGNYERLEFLGDSLLSLIVSDLLIEQFPNFKEGELSRFRASLVNEDAIAELARLVGIPELVLVGRGERLKTQECNERIISDTFEAVLGAIYLDGGFEATRSVYRHVVGDYNVTMGHQFFSSERLDEFDSKSRLQETTMKLYKELPVYRATLMPEGVFMVELILCGQKIGEYFDVSKKRAENKLARLVLKEELYRVK